MSELWVWCELWLVLYEAMQFSYYPKRFLVKPGLARPTYICDIQINGGVRQFYSTEMELAYEVYFGL